jgi:hypothetical protein
MTASPFTFAQTRTHAAMCLSRTPYHPRMAEETTDGVEILPPGFAAEAPRPDLAQLPLSTGLGTLGPSPDKPYLI